MNRRTEVIDGNSYSFSVGMELILEKRGNFPIKLQRTRLLGWEKNLCLIIRPIEDDLPLVEFEDEQECVVRFFDSGKVNRFHTKVLRQCKYFFFPILLLMFPEQIYTTRYRKNRRYAASINGFFTNQTGEFVVNCLITDMSIKGCRLSISADNDLELENKEILLNINDTAYGNIE